MSCYRLWWAVKVKTGGVRAPSRAGVSNEVGDSFQLPCGRCIGCMMEKRMIWSIRCTHEASTWTHNCFVTLTYDNKHLPENGSLDPDEFTRFLKRLRKAKKGVELAPGSETDRPIRYFACGEYGEGTRRAHYHALLFNVRFEDARKYDQKLSVSKVLDTAWGNGSAKIAAVEPASIAYVTGYELKKQQAEAAPLDVVDFETGEVVGTRVPPFTRMSRMPAIGTYWYRKYKRDLASGFLRHDGKSIPVPRFYEDKYREDFPEEQEERDYARALARLGKDPTERLPSRLSVKEAVALARRSLTKHSKTEF